MKKPDMITLLRAILACNVISVAVSAVGILEVVL